METPSEWAKRFNQAKADEAAEASKLEEAAATTRPAPEAEFPSEPFLCPACGQLLGPSCRVCVACKHRIDPAELARTPAEAPALVAQSTTSEPMPDPVRFSWSIFFAVLGVSCLIAIIIQGLLKDQQQMFLAMGGVQALAGTWVFLDARRQGIPRPLRWMMGTLFLPMVIFPWYLARRRKPQSPVPFLEAVSTARLVIIVMLVFLLVNLIMYVVQGPPTIIPSLPQPQIQKPAENPPAQITNLRVTKADLL